MSGQKPELNWNDNTEPAKQKKTFAARLGQFLAYLLSMLLAIIICLAGVWLIEKIGTSIIGML